ncbi:hypothetical protein SLEP1_g56114 [Rubroshorea leprosula]|uniref:Uncharacterized protein n=1 Tax=Rubroshorea leprosula TaxID=152421 RepID=A0AAV5MK19_9ROSI|nr:hypothetical protein SLEP1_g56114 [Rubroshorea leprosula]
MDYRQRVGGGGYGFLPRVSLRLGVSPSSSSSPTRVSPLAPFLHHCRLSCFGNFNPRDHKAKTPFNPHRLLIFDDCVWMPRDLIRSVVGFLPFSELDFHLCMSHQMRSWQGWQSEKLAPSTFRSSSQILIGLQWHIRF